MQSGLYSVGAMVGHLCPKLAQISPLSHVIASRKRTRRAPAGTNPTLPTGIAARAPRTVGSTQRIQLCLKRSVRDTAPLEPDPLRCYSSGLRLHPNSPCGSLTPRLTKWLTRNRPTLLTADIYG